ncbi:hypothetical protein [Streptomyces albicerus]|uniref:hypothetical protein n=1 Tax=Streptomyces albicerus TaxID=2569859 RepID=UPI00124BB823|nr:hypothetical protein [Streptomyces albicerus]
MSATEPSAAYAWCLPHGPLARFTGPECPRCTDILATLTAEQERYSDTEFPHHLSEAQRVALVPAAAGEHR